MTRAPFFSYPRKLFFFSFVHSGFFLALKSMLVIALNQIWIRVSLSSGLFIITFELLAILIRECWASRSLSSLFWLHFANYHCSLLSKNQLKCVKKRKDKVHCDWISYEPSSIFHCISLIVCAPNVQWNTVNGAICAWILM